MLYVKDLRALAARLNESVFAQQVGPFALVQNPPQPVVEQMSLRLGAQNTMVGGGADPKAMQLAVLLRFDELMVATLPPLRSEDELSVGRMPNCDLVINDPSVSKNHALLRWNGESGACIVVDLQSTNGTWINGRTIEADKAFFVRDGDVLRFGDADFAYFTSKSLWTRLRR